MSLLNISDNQYFLSLDSLDLNLLSRFIDKAPDEKRLLWSRPFMNGESTYCQVIIESKEFHDDDCHLEPSETYMCHICNIDVPQIYFKQHVKSKMHHNHRKLTEKVLENLTKQIYVDIDNTGCNEHSNQFYCETCSKVVSVENKQKHNKSMYHLKSIEDQKLTDNFIEIYVDKKEVKNVINDKIASNNDNIKGSNNARHFEYLSDSDTDQSSKSNTEFIHTDNYNSMCPINHVLKDSLELSNIHESSSSEEESSETDDEVSRALDTSKNIANFLLYVKEMILKYKLQIKMPIVDGNSIVIVTPKGFITKISTDAFHGFTNIGNFIRCHLCKSWVDNYTNHIRSEEHVMNIIQPVNDDFAREVIHNKAFNHCLVCNALVAKGSNHAALKHEKYNEPMPLKTPKQKFCDVCIRYIDGHNFLGHTESKKHQANVKRKRETNSPTIVVKNNTSLKKQNDESPIQTATIDKFSSAVAVDSNVIQNKLYCDVCEVMVPQGGMTVHERGKQHRNKCTTNNKTPNQDMLKSTTSDTNLPSMSQAEPVNLSAQGDTKDFTIKEKLIEYNKQMTRISGKELQCLVCNVKVSSLDEHIIEHVEGLKHKKIINSLLNVSKMGKISTSSFYCEICKCSINNFFDHINQDIDHKFKFLPLYKTQLKEHVYDKPVNNDPIACAYRQIHNNMLEQHKIGRLTSTLYYCNVCSFSLSQKNEIDHMLNERHISLLKVTKIRDTVNSTSNGNNLPSTSEAAEKQSPQIKTKEYTVKEKILQYKKQMAGVSAQETECLVCNIKVPNLVRNIIEHVEGSKHKEDMKSLLLVSKISQISFTSFYCEICDVYFNNFIDHINKDEDHKLKFLSLYKTQLREHVYDYPLRNDRISCTYRRVHVDMLERNKIVRLTSTLYFCDVCSVSLNRQSEIDHMLSERHQSYLKLKSS